MSAHPATEAPVDQAPPISPDDLSGFGPASTPSPADIARDYLQRGWCPIPVPFKSKIPNIPDWQHMQLREEDLASAFSGKRNIGVVLGPKSFGLTDVDLDCPEAVALAPHFLERTGAIFGRPSNPESHWLYQTSLAQAVGKATIQYRDPKRPKEEAMLVEIRVGGETGAQTVFPGSIHETGESIKWSVNGEPAKVEDGELRGRVTMLASACLLARYWPGEGARHDAALTLGGFLSRAGYDPAQIKYFVEAIARTAGDPEHQDRKRAAEDAAKAYQQGKRAGGFPQLSKAFGKEVASQIAEWLEYRARNDDDDRTGARQQGGESANDNTDDDEHRPPAFTEEALALKFAALHQEDMRYVAPWGRWMIWDGTRWLFDETLRAFDLARKLCRQASAECNKSKAANVLASAKTVAAIKRLAKTDRRLAATTDQWDANPWLLNTPDGVIDLKTGEQRPHRPEDYLTRITAVGAGGECPTWKAFLKRVTGGDTELQSFLQRMSGLALTGDTSAHALFFMHGSGANGKSVFLSTVSGIALEYHKTAPIETFTASSIDRHPTDLAGLRGARMVTAIETEEGRRWAESRIKALTGGDKISARFMRQDFFEFTPQFKLIIAGNHKPGLRSVDEAIRRRFHLIPFTVTIPPAERDLTLADRLRAEWPGILAWMIEGCLDWQRQGLAPPKAVTSATEEYMSSEDALATWMAESCVLKADASALASDLFASWRTWAEAAGEMAGSQKKFSQSLENRPGISKERTERGALYHGLRPCSFQ